MKTVIITGNARGFGYEMTKLFYKKNFNVVLCDMNETALSEAYKNLSKIKGNGQILSYVVDVTKKDTIENMVNDVVSKLGTIDIWINNAGVNQPSVALWELDEHTINRLVDIDLKGAILSTSVVMPIMIKQGFGQIYNVEGHGSNDAKIFGISLYGTAKRAITYYTEALAMESEKKKTNVLIGKITPGIMLTNFVHTSLGNEKHIEIDERTKKIYNILGDYPETIAAFMVDKIIANKKNNVRFMWLTNRRAFGRFIGSIFHKREIFK